MRHITCVTHSDVTILIDPASRPPTSPLSLTLRASMPRQSYAGKYIPAFATAIHERNAARRAAGQPLVPLIGFAIGDGWTEPSTQSQV